MWWLHCCLGWPVTVSTTGPVWISTVVACQAVQHLPATPVQRYSTAPVGYTCPKVQYSTCRLHLSKGTVQHLPATSVQRYSTVPAGYTCPKVQHLPATLSQRYSTCRLHLQRDCTAPVGYTCPKVQYITCRLHLSKGTVHVRRTLRRLVKICFNSKNKRRRIIKLIVVCF